VMGENAGQIMPADRVRPGFDKPLDFALFRPGLLPHGSHSLFADMVPIQGRPDGVESDSDLAKSRGL